MSSSLPSATASQKMVCYTSITIKYTLLTLTCAQMTRWKRYAICANTCDLWADMGAPLSWLGSMAELAKFRKALPGQ